MCVCLKIIMSKQFIGKDYLLSHGHISSNLGENLTAWKVSIVHKIKKSGFEGGLLCLFRVVPSFNSSSGFELGEG